MFVLLEAEKFNFSFTSFFFLLSCIFVSKIYKNVFCININLYVYNKEVACICNLFLISWHKMPVDKETGKEEGRIITHPVSWHSNTIYGGGKAALRIRWECCAILGAFSKCDKSGRTLMSVSREHKRGKESVIHCQYHYREISSPYAFIAHPILVHICTLNYVIQMWLYLLKA